MFQAINEHYLLWEYSDGVATEGSDRFACGQMQNEVTLACWWRLRSDAIKLLNTINAVIFF
jgi:hypothetical protein